MGGREGLEAMVRGRGGGDRLGAVGIGQGGGGGGQGEVGGRGSVGGGRDRLEGGDSLGELGIGRGWRGEVGGFTPQILFNKES